MFSEVPGLEGISPDFFSRVCPVFLSPFQLFSLHPWTCYSRVSRAPLEEREGQSDTGGNSRPCSLRGLTRPLPQFLGAPGLLFSSSSPSGFLSPGQGVKPDLGFDPSLPLVILLEVGRGQPGPAQSSPAPEGGRPRRTRVSPNPGKPSRGLRAIFLQPRPRSSPASTSRTPPASPSILL